MPPWSTSDRASRLPADWKYRRVGVRARAADQCEAAIAPGIRCPYAGTECDHIVNNDDHSLDNLAWLCEDHHRTKTLAEAERARSAMYARGRHPVEPHPGIR